MPTEEDDVDIPSIYVDQSLLSNVPVSSKKAFTVNDQVFYEEDVEDSLVEFEVFQMDVEGDMYCSTPSGSESECEDDCDTELCVTLQTVPNGFIINESCFLTWQQWNTLVTPAVSIKLLHCLVCAQYCEADGGNDHVSTANHRLALQACPPLDKYDLSVTRKIRNQYHCAVCNEAFDITAELEHFSGKMHEGNLLFSINKASDLLDNSYGNNNCDKADTYLFKTHDMDNAINDTESVGSEPYHDNLNFINFQNNYYDDFEEEPPVFTGLSYATMAKKPKAQTQTYIEVDLGNKKVSVRYDSWHMVISPQANRFWCMVCRKFDHLRKKQQHCSETGHLDNLHRCKVLEHYQHYFIRQVDDKLYHCGHCNNLQLIHEMEDHIETNHPRKKLVNETKTKNSPVKGDSKAQSNKNDARDSPIRDNGKAQINKNNVMDSPIRDYDKAQTNKESNVANKNNNNDVKIVAKNSPKKLKYTVTNSSISKDNNQNASTVKYTATNTNNDIKNMNTVNDKKPITNTTNDSAITNPTDINTINNGIINTTNMTSPFKMNTVNNNNNKPPFNISAVNNKNVTNTRNDSIITNPFQMNTIHDKNPINTRNDINIQNVHGNNLYYKMTSIFDDIVIYPFGYKITVSSLGYNIVCKWPKDYYCGLCDVVCIESAIEQHVYEVRHRELLQRTPFIAPFSYNLIRAIRDRLHCAICNIAIFVNDIKNHIQQPQHVQALHIALNQGPKLPPIGVKIPNIPETLPGYKTPSNFGPSPNLSPNVTNANISNINNAQNVTKANISNVNNVQNVTNNIESNITKAEFSKTSNNEVNNTKIVNEDTEDYKEDDNSDLEVEEIERTFDSMASEDASLDEEEHVYLKLKNTYIKISNTSYNTLLHVGDGSRYCFVCSTQVLYVDLQKHVDARTHMENMDKYQFLDKYEDHLLRQIYLMYHCAICNVIVNRKDLKSHIEWPTHALQNVTLKNLKKTRKTEIKGGVKQIVVSTQKENIYLHDNEPKVKICLNVKLCDKLMPKVEKKESVVKEFSRKNKIIIFNDNVLKVSWESWHAISKIKSGYKCNLCQRELKDADIDAHCSSEWHRYGLDKPFDTRYRPALIRKINETTLNCLFCNTEVSNKEHLVQVHINGKKHVKNYEEILKDSSLAHTYTDCHDDVLML